MVPVGEDLVARGRLQRHDRHIDQPRRLGVAPGQRHPRQRRSRRRLALGGAHRFEERGVEQLRQRPSDGLVRRHPLRALERAVPPDDAVVEVGDEESILQRFQDVLVEAAQPVELHGLDMQLPVQAGVVERGGNLAGHGAEQRHVLAAQRLGAVLQTEREHGGRARLRHAGHEVEEARIAPRVDVFRSVARDGRRVVQRHGVTGLEPLPDARPSRQRQVQRAHPVLVHDRERPVRVLVEEQRHPVHDQRFHDAGHQTLGQTLRIEVGVQIARKAHQGQAVVVPVLVEGPVERGLHEVLHGRRQQQRHQGAEDARSPSPARRPAMGTGAVPPRGGRRTSRRPPPRWWRRSAHASG